MHNGFLIIRSVFFSLLTLLGLLVIIFASWNVSTSTSAGLTAPTTPILMILDSCVLFFCICVGLLELFYSEIKTSVVLFECSWVALLSIFQLGASISVTVDGATMTCQDSDWSICASSSLLIVVGWLSCMIGLSYFFVLFFTSMSHRREIEVWRRSIYSIDWFSRGSGERNETTLHSNNIESDFRKSVCNIAPWAKTSNFRRGVDHPFKLSDNNSSGRTSQTSLPCPPLNIRPKDTFHDTPIASRFIERFRTSWTEPHTEIPSIYGSGSPIILPFPPVIIDHDLPIPLPRLSEWLRADTLNIMDTQRR